MALVYAEEWAVSLQERLDKPQNWKEVCNVEYTNMRVLHKPYLTDFSVASGTRNTAYTPQAVSETDDSLTINQYAIVPVVIDRADMAQSTYSKQMNIAENQGTLLNEKLENYLLSLHGDWTNMGDVGGGAIGLGSTPFAVSASNVDDTIHAVIREIQKANGFSLMRRNGAFIVWRPQDFECLVAFMQANGFNEADKVLRDGADSGVYYMGVYHYVSNSHTSGHLFAGVRKLEHLGIVRETYGQIVIVDEPYAPTGTGSMSGTGVIARVDYVGKTWTKYLPVLYDVNVT